MELNAFEEGRHKHVLANLVRAYGIELGPEPDDIPPRDVEWAFMVTGFSECIDSFFAFGLFELAKRSGFSARASCRPWSGWPEGSCAEPIRTGVQTWPPATWTADSRLATACSRAISPAISRKMRRLHHR